MKKTLSFAIGLLLLVGCTTVVTPPPHPQPPPVPPNITPPMDNVVVRSHVNALLINPGFPVAPNTDHWVTLDFGKRQPVTFTVFQKNSLFDDWTQVTNTTSCQVDLSLNNVPTMAFYKASASVFPIQRVGLAWNPSVDPSVTGYNVYYGTASRSYSQQVNVGLVTNTAVSNIVAGTTYYFAVTAYNTEAESDFSDEAVYFAASNAVPFSVAITSWPKAPQVITLAATNVTATTATLQGQVIDSGRDLTATVFFYGTNDPYADTNADWGGFVNSGISTNTASGSLVNLLPNTTYYFSFAALNAAGIGSSTNSLSFTTPALPVLEQPTP